MSLSFEHLRCINVARCVEGWNHQLEGWSSADWLIAVAGELGEALNVVKKLNRERDGIIGNTRTAADLVRDLADEIADTAIYLDLFLASHDDATIFSADTSILKRLGQDLLKGEGLEGFGTSSCAGKAAIKYLGHLADDERNRNHSARLLFLSLYMLADVFGIDMGVAIVTKFNRTSEKHGMPHRLVRA